MLKKVLITGSAGQSGRAITQLLANQYEVIGIDIIESPYTHIRGDLTDWPLLKKITKGVEAIIHTAALHAPHVPTHTREDFINTNIKATLYLLEAAVLHRIPKMIYTSTTSLYGESMDNPSQAVWITEEVVPVARDIYDITKLTAEALCKDFFEADKLQTVSLRVSRFWEEPLDKKVFYRMYRGVDVRDVAMAHRLGLTQNFDTFETFNISAQSIFDQTDVVDLRHNLYPLLQRLYPKILEFFQKQQWILPTYIDRVYVIEKAKKLLGYQPVYNIEQMLVALENTL